MAALVVVAAAVLLAFGGPVVAGEASLGPSKRRTITDEDRAFWSLRPVGDPPVPVLGDPGAAGAKKDVDRFVVSKLRVEGLTPAAEADRRTLIRRATFDLHGLPPTPDEVDAFVADQSPDAYEKLIDKLLASPAYGERWARHWLDLVRYAESDGHRQDEYRPDAWPYRDYVIKSFNDDKPYDRFVAEQLAGDEIAPDDPDALVATGFLRHGMYEYNQRDVRKQWSEILNDVTDVTADVFLGLSMGCARCHDHKFDPILQSDYYQLQAFFAPMLPRHDLPRATPQQKAEYAAALKQWEEKTAEIRAGLEAIERPEREKVAKPAIDKFPPDIAALLAKPAPERTPLEHQLAELAYRQVLFEFQRSAGKIEDKKQRERWAELMRRLGEFDAIRPKPLPPAFAATDVGPVGPPAAIFGDPQGRTFEPGYPTVLATQAQPLKVPPIEPKASSTGRRTALAKWLTDPAHPLTARVMVNRIWQYHFGRGLVATSSDYGRLGERPSHPELLDYLAKRFVENGWSLKKAHRLIMTSATYRQASVGAVAEAARLKDPDNRLLWRYPARRLDAEQIRDAMLAVGGELDPTAGGPPVDGNTPRRSVYTKTIRNSPDPVLAAFDAPDAFGSAPTRNRTTTATQSLLMVNDPWPLRRAEAFAARLKKLRSKGGGEDAEAETVRAAYRLAYGRAPDAEELAGGVDFLRGRDAGAPVASGGADTEKTAAAGDLPLTRTMPHRGGQAVVVRDGRPLDMLRAADNPALPSGGDFTVEAVVLLESLYPSAEVRVIASQWNGEKSTPGWALGVTSEKSKYQPRNLILQICDGRTYEVIPSDFRVELHKSYYLAASVKMSQSGPAGVTFYLKDLGDNDAPLRSVVVPHNVTGSYDTGAALVIGGTDGTYRAPGRGAPRPPFGWDGLADEVRVTAAALTAEQLFYNSEPGPQLQPNVAGHWLFEETPGLLKDSAGKQAELVRADVSAAAAEGSGSSSSSSSSSADPALVDFCHALLNASEFLYVD